LDELLSDADGSLTTLSILTLFQTVDFGITGLVVMGVLLSLSTLVIAAGYSLLSLSTGQIRDIRSSSGSLQQRIVRMMEHTERLSATVGFTTIILNVINLLLWAGFVSGLEGLEGRSLLTALLLFIPIVLLFLVFGEILPRIFASRYRYPIALFMAWPLYILSQLLYPITFLIVRAGSYAEFISFRKNQLDDMNELTDALEIPSDEITPEEEKKILKGIVKFGDIEVNEIMRIQMDVVAVDESTGFRELIRIVTSSGYSRIPVYQDSFDNVTGILYVKDLLPHLDKTDEFNWRSLIRSALFVPENKPINDLLKEFQHKKIHMAIVVDEYGGTSGIVTLEDIIEEIVGEISDEYDTEGDEVTYNRVDDHTWMFEGKTSLNDFCKILEIDDMVFEEVKGESESLAGLILEMIGKIPHKGENVTWGDFVFHIESVDTRRIKKVKVTIDHRDEDE
jgi:gliding motility-associated protein GldE